MTEHRLLAVGRMRLRTWPVVAVSLLGLLVLIVVSILAAQRKADIDVPVLIVGGRGAGPTASMLLSQLGIETLLVSALPTTSILPKAHVLNQRTMEILADIGVAEAIYEKSTPAENMAASRASTLCTVVT